MNAYGRTALDHWKRWLPRRFSQIEDPESYFSTLGEEIQARVEALSRAIAGEDPPGEEYLAKVQRLNMAKQNAESEALRELALLEPETEEDPEQPETPA